MICPRIVCGCQATAVCGLLGWFLCAELSFSQAGDWPHWRGPQRDSTAESLPISAQTEFEVAWSREVGTGFSSIVVAGDRLVTMGNIDDQDIVWCVDPATGEELWRHVYATPLNPNLFEGGPTSTPTISGDALFSLSRRGDLHCLDLQTGVLRWHVNLVQRHGYDIPEWGFSSAPLVHEELVIVNVGSAGVAVEVQTGETRWKSDNSDPAGYSTPAYFDQLGRQLLLIYSGKNATAVDPLSGQQVWQHRWITRYGVNAADPYPFEGHLFLSSGYGKGSALLRLTDGEPEELWRSRELRNQLSPGVLFEGCVYAVDGDAGSENDLVCFSIQDQKRNWSYRGLGSATLLRTGDHLLVLSEEGELVIAPLSPEEFRPIVRQQVLSGRCWTMPAVAAGKIFVRNAEGALQCLTLVNH